MRPYQRYVEKYGESTWLSLYGRLLGEIRSYSRRALWEACTRAHAQAGITVPTQECRCRILVVTMDRLCRSLDFRNQPRVLVYAVEGKE